MYKEVAITQPVFEVGPKAYIYGDAAVKLAKHADLLSKRYDVQIIFTPQYVDIPTIARETENILIFAQHMDPLKVGRGIGSVLPEAVKAAGAVGVMLNHVEKKLSVSVLEQTIRRADEVGLATMVCADNLDEAIQVASMKPNCIIVESPELIGGGKRKKVDQSFIRDINETIWGISSDIVVFHGAGINSEKDVFDVVSSGAQGTGSTSGILLADDPLSMLEKMMKAMREAWDKKSLCVPKKESVK